MKACKKSTVALWQKCDETGLATLLPYPTLSCPCSPQPQLLQGPLFRAAAHCLSMPLPLPFSNPCSCPSPWPVGRQAPPDTVHQLVHTAPAHRL